jgi:hypothetical protein
MFGSCELWLKLVKNVASVNKPHGICRCREKLKRSFIGWFFNWKSEGDPSPDSVQESPSHNYTHKGSYTVMLVAEGPVFNNLVLHTVEVSTAPPEPPEPPEPPKASSIVLYNCHSDYQTLAIWVWDQTADTDWKQMGTLDSQWDDWGTCPVVGAPFTMELEDEHSGSSLRTYEIMSSSCVLCCCRCCLPSPSPR